MNKQLSTAKNPTTNIAFYYGFNQRVQIALSTLSHIIMVLCKRTEKSEITIMSSLWLEGFRQMCNSEYVGR